MWAILFIFGVAIGSFINVLSLRYEDGQSIFFTKRVQGRSHCMHCKKVLHWYELIPIISFVIQCGACRGCKKPLRWQYPLIELITGLLTAILPFFLFRHLAGISLLSQDHSLIWIYLTIGLWLVATYTCITLSAIDLRLQLIPDQSNILLGLIGIVLITIKSLGLIPYQSFLGSYGATLGAPDSPMISALIAAGVALLIFGGIVFLTKERGMGMGDVKLAIPLALILGWPDSIIAFAAAFVIGSVVGLLLIARRRATMKAAVPFGPFLVIGFFVAVFYGEVLARWYFSLV